MIGGGGEKVTLRIAAQHADLWHSFGNPEEWARKNAILTEWCGTVGRDPGAIERSVSISDTRREDAATFVKELDARAAAYIAAGATDFVFGVTPPYDLTAVEALLAWRERHG
jgi:alkanesulfonate monooxygenase SsuD/methylene tetrahydromethanopterin reductase-like flavin-dependent oxidoreductase (luciferase family)